MHLSRFIRVLVFFCSPVMVWAAPSPKSGQEQVAATIDTTLTSAAGQIRQFAFDGDPNRYFASVQNATAADHFTLVFDKPVAVKSIVVTTGKPDGNDSLEAGTLDVSADNKTFEPLTTFVNGVARAQPEGRQVQAIRVKPAADLRHSLAIREFVVESSPAVMTFKYPVEFVVDVTEVPDMKEWAEKAAKICERNYAMICEELKSDAFKPLTVIKLTLRNAGQGVPGVAAASGGRITGNARFFKQNPDDFGAIVHETVHCVQLYGRSGGGRNPGWLVEGVADYIRFFKYEPGKLRPLRPERARYNGSYQVTAAFLGFVCEKYDKELVRKLNALMRQGEYKDESFKTLTGKTIGELEVEWKASLRG